MVAFRTNGAGEAEPAWIHSACRRDYTNSSRTGDAADKTDDEGDE
jgi:hypothetical protein